MALIIGNDGANSLTGGSSDDVIYGYDPNGSQATATSITAERVASGLTQPLFAGAPKGDPSRLFIVEKAGVIKILDLNSGQILATPFLDIADEVNDLGERGLLGLAFDPDFADNGDFYVYLINNSGDTEIRRYTVSANPNVANEASETLILTIDQPDFANHKAGWIGFGPDGYLYIATGDGGSGGDPFNNGQNINTLLGKILRIDVHNTDPGLNYAIPDDNPFVGVAGADEIYAYGLRNPFRDSFDRALGTFFIADVGQGTWEEIDLGQLGANYGWDSFEGPNPFPGGSPLGGPSSHTPPIHFYGRSVGATVIGGYVYRGSAEGLQGQLFFADTAAATISTLRQSGSTWIATDLTSKIATNAGAINQPVSFGEDGFGNLYVVDLDGEVFKLTPNTTSADLGDTLNGGAGSDMLFGGSGNDVLTGGPGADLLNGGPGADTASYAASPQAVTVNLSTGVGSGGDAAGDLLQDIENIIGSAFGDTLIGDDGNNSLAGGGGANTLNGGAGNDMLFGGSGNDTLIGGSGADLLNGGSGFDTASYVLSPAGVAVNLLTGVGSGGDAQGDILQGIENIIGSAHGDNLGGTNGNNVFVPGAGNDTVDGRGGSDTVSYSNIAQGITVNLSATTNQATGAGIGTDQLISIENVIGSQGNDTLIGNAAANVLSGLAGNDTLNGASGNDNLSGGDGSDTFRGGAGADVTNGGAGNDVFQIAGSEALGDTFIGGSGIDRVQVLGSGATALSGFNAATVSIEQWQGNNQGLFGTAANNVFNFSAFTSKTGLPFIDGGGGNDSITGSKFADVLRGGAGKDTLNGGAQNDILTGGSGRDVLTGGSGSDRFDFNKIKESKNGSRNSDKIADFSRKQGDKIDLRDIDANTEKSGNQKFKFIGSDSFNEVASELRYKNHILQGDVNGDGKADFEIRVSASSLKASDFIL